MTQNIEQNIKNQLALSIGAVIKSISSGMTDAIGRIILFST